jgi:hypothetical protein
MRIVLKNVSSVRAFAAHAGTHGRDLDPGETFEVDQATFDRHYARHILSGISPFRAVALVKRSGRRRPFVLTVPADLYDTLPEHVKGTLADVASMAQQHLLASKHTGPVTDDLAPET